ncbi:hypothetical protein [Blastococcus sp. SYSU DS0619]
MDAGAVVCPVALRYRAAGGVPTAAAGYFGGDSLRQSLGRVIGTRGLVLEVHLLPALEPGGDRRSLAALAEYAVAEVTEALPPANAAHARAARPPGAAQRVPGAPDDVPQPAVP